IRYFHGTGVQSCALPIFCQRSRDTCVLQLQEPVGKVAPLVGQVKQALAPILRARLLQNIATIDELLQNTRQTLLGNLEAIKQIGNPQTWVTVDEVENTVVGAAEAELGQNGVRLPGEVPVREEQELDESDELLTADLFGRLERYVLAPRFHRSGPGCCIYVSHVDLFGCHCYPWQVPSCTGLRARLFSSSPCRRFRPRGRAALRSIFLTRQRH